MNKRILYTALSCCFGLILFFSCKKNDGNTSNTGNFDRKAMLTDYADGYILPAYQDMLAKLNDLKTKTDLFTASPDSVLLADLRASWQAAYFTWQRVDLLEFGPAEDITLRMYMNIYPASATKINSYISSGSYDLESFGSNDAKGFPALDYLLNGLAATNEDVIAHYTTNMNAGNRKQYLLAVVNKMIEKTGQVNDQWTAYRNTFIESTGTDVNSSFSKMTNAFVLYYERYLRGAKIGSPVGAMTGVAVPAYTEAYYTPVVSKELAVEAVRSVKQFYQGVRYDGATDGKGLSDYLTAVGTKDDNGQLIAALIVDELDEAISSLESLNGTIRESVTNNRPAVLAIYDDLQDLVPLFKVDMVSALGISITYVDNDGD
jgi:predicted lipoprotein